MFRVFLNRILNPHVYTSMRATVNFFIQYGKRRRTVQNLLDRYAVQSRGKMEINIALIVVDCLRLDHTSLVGYQRDTTPFLKKIAQKGTIFANCYTPAPWTYPAVLSILTGFYPHKHGGVYKHEPRNWDNHEKEGYPCKLRDDVLLLSEVMNQFGCQTIFMSDICPVVVAIQNRDPSYLLYQKNKVCNPVNLLNALNLNRQFFLYVHLGNLHAPVCLPEKFQYSFGDIDMSVSNLNYNEWSYRHGDLDKPNFVEYKGNRIKLYDSSLRFVDSIVESLVRRIQEESDLETLFIITADHGEEFWEHAKIEKELFYDPRKYWGIGHGHNLFQEIIKVPLIFSRKFQSGISVRNVSTIDIFPTILELLSIDHKIPCDGDTLLSSETERAVLSEEVAYGYEKKAIIHEDHKLIVSDGDRVSLLFNLLLDSEEKEPVDNLSLRKILEAKLPQVTRMGDKQNVTSEMERRLRELGYV